MLNIEMDNWMFEDMKDHSTIEMEIVENTISLFDKYKERARRIYNERT